jgi:hypothetical protein
VGLHENADHAALDLGTTVHMRRLQARPARKSVLSVGSCSHCARQSSGRTLPVYSGGRQRLTERALSAGPAVAAGIVLWRGCNWREREESQSARSIDLADAKLEVAF